MRNRVFGKRRKIYTPNCSEKLSFENNADTLCIQTIRTVINITIDRKISVYCISISLLRQREIFERAYKTRYRSFDIISAAARTIQIFPI